MCYDGQRQAYIFSLDGAAEKERRKKRKGKRERERDRKRERERERKRVHLSRVKSVSSKMCLQ